MLLFINLYIFWNTDLFIDLYLDEWLTKKNKNRLYKCLEERLK